MENRIDLTQIKELNFEGWPKWIHDVVMEIDEMYEKEDALIAEVKDLITYDQEDEMWVYDESKSSNPGLDAMDILINLAYDK
jgi:hypothetical protein